MQETVTFRSEAKTLADLLEWLGKARYGDFCVYHTGSLSIDRQADKDLSQRADTVLLLQDMNYVFAAQMRQNVDSPTLYTATRTGMGYAPHQLLQGKVTALEWRMLFEIRKTSRGRSVTRIIRDMLSTSSDAAAVAQLERLKAREWIEPDPATGWKLSPAGNRILL